MPKPPEKQALAVEFYKDAKAQKYTTSSHTINVQTNLSERALELLALPKDGTIPRLFFDIGCGSGLSGTVLSEHGHYWMGINISKAMLDVALEREVEGNLLLNGIGEGLMFWLGCIDGAISISIIQWLCNAYKSSDRPSQRLGRFFSSLYACFASGARAVLQIYNENESQRSMIHYAAVGAGFTGGFVEDYPYNTRAKKTYLCFMTRGPSVISAIGITDDENQAVKFESRSNLKKPKTLEKKNLKRKTWILRKKEQRRQKVGVDNVPRDTKYTGWKKKAHF